MICGQVSDTGCGISKENLANLFIPFYKGWVNNEGMGLGLIVARGIVERFGGRIEVKSEYGVGSTFTILLPSVSST